MNLREAADEVLNNGMARNATLIESRSGFGKSDMMWQFVDRIKKLFPKLKVGVGITFLATQSPADMIGLQFKGTREYVDRLGNRVTATVSDPSFPTWYISVPHGDDPGGLPADAYDIFILILEEYGQGDLDTKRVAAQLLLKGEVQQFRLPPGTDKYPGSIRVGLTNAGKRYGVTNDFDFAIARRMHRTLDPDSIVWAEDFAEHPYEFGGRTWQMDPLLVAFGKTNQKVLFEPEPKEQGPWCNPRTFTAMSRYVQVSAEARGITVAQAFDVPVIQEGVIGHNGQPAFQAVHQFIKFAIDLPQYIAVVTDPQGTRLPDRADLKLLMVYELAARLEAKDDHIQAAIDYVKRMQGGDLAITFVKQLMRKDFRKYINTKPMDKWIASNKSLGTLLSV